jgi:hypothetical protein
VFRSVFSHGVAKINYMMQFLAISGTDHEQTLCKLAKVDAPVRQRVAFSLFSSGEPPASSASSFSTPPRQSAPPNSTPSPATPTTGVGSWLEGIYDAITIVEAAESSGLPPLPPSN